jgi:glycosyltransferase involved in cell wall biosynthesis
VSLAVIVPTVGRIDPLRRLLTSIAAQTTAPDELLIVDQNAAGFLDRLLREFPFATRIASDEANLAAARNAGFVATSSTHVLFVDDDEVIDPDFCERVTATFAKHPEVHCLWPIVHGPGARAAALRHWQRLGERPQIGGSTLFRIRRIAGGGAAFERDFFRATGGYDETLYRTAHMGEDWELSARMRRRRMTMWCDASLFVLHDPATEGGCETRALPLAEARRRVMLSTFLQLRIAAAPRFRLSPSAIWHIVRFGFLSSIGRPDARRDAVQHPLRALSLVLRIRQESLLIMAENAERYFDYDAVDHLRGRLGGA